MKREKVVPDNPQPIVLSRWVGITLLLLLLVGGVYLYFYYFIKCIDGCGPYHNTTSVADLDGDGDLDVVLFGLRHETETIFWAGPTLWINQGGGKFTPRRVELGGPATAAGDLDGDRDADLVQMEYTAALFLNQGGEQGGKPGEFKRWRSIAPQEDPHNWSTPGTVVLGDLNNDGRLDALVSYCCAMLIERQALGDDLLPFLPWVWLNIPDEWGSLKGHSLNLISLGDLPMRPTLGDLDGDGDAGEVTVLFTDLSGFTALTETHGDQDAADIVARLYDLAQATLTDEARLVKTIGDAVMIVAGQPAAAVTTALRLVGAVQGEPGFPAVRAGLHLGPCVERAGDYIGATVNLAARVAAYARADQILCTEIVADAVRPLDIVALHPAGVGRFKNVALPVTLFEIEDVHRRAGYGDIDPVCRMRLDPERAPARLPYGDRTYHFCSFNCAQKFAQTPEAYLKT